MLPLLGPEFENDPNALRTLIDIESNIVVTLQFELQVQTPLVFLGRYLTFYTHGATSEFERTVLNHTATQFLKFAVLKSAFLKFSPSHLAAAVMVLCFNLYNCPEAAIQIGLARQASSVSELAQKLSRNAPFDPV